jgi:hypothetical protein
MARLTDPELQRCYHNALANWRYTDFIQFKKDAAEWLRRELPGFTQKRFGELLYNYVVKDGGEIDQVVENREPWREQFSHHYDLRPVVNGIKLYVETRLIYSDPNDPDDPVIYVVNIHPA